MKDYWTFLNYKRNMRTGESPVGLLYIAAMLLRNICNFMYPGPVSQYFKCDPPTLDLFVPQNVNTFDDLYSIRSCAPRCTTLAYCLLCAPLHCVQSRWLPVTTYKMSRRVKNYFCSASLKNSNIIFIFFMSCLSLAALSSTLL